MAGDSYHHYPRRLRCRAYLVHKALGLAKRMERKPGAKGEWVLTILGNPDGSSVRRPERPARRPTDRRCPTVGRFARRLAKDARAAPIIRKPVPWRSQLCNDGAAIFQVLSHPKLSLTSNDTKRALRH